MAAFFVRDFAHRVHRARPPRLTAFRRSFPAHFSYDKNLSENAMKDLPIALSAR
jgi:citrate synthase